MGNGGVDVSCACGEKGQRLAAGNGAAAVRRIDFGGWPEN